MDGIYRPGAISTVWTVTPRCSSGLCDVDIVLSNRGKLTYRYSAGKWSFQYHDPHPCPAFQGVFTATATAVDQVGAGPIHQLQVTYLTAGQDCQGQAVHAGGTTTLTRR